MKNLGCMNGWYGITRYPNGWDMPPVKEPDRVPPEYTACSAARHPLTSTKLGNCWYQYECPICGIQYDIESSD
jgi:hypothetical protein